MIEFIQIKTLPSSLKVRCLSRRKSPFKGDLEGLLIRILMVIPRSIS